jgi:lipoprotein-releasing system permease protein
VRREEPNKILLTPHPSPLTPHLLMSLESLIARRYLFGKDKPFMASLLAFVGAAGVAIGVFSLILIQAAMAGFSQDLRNKILGFSAPVILKPISEEFLSGKKSPPIPSDSRVTSISPFLETEVIIHTADNLAQGSKLKGVDFSTDPVLLKRLKVEFVEGLGVEDLKPKEDQLPGILLGSELTKRLNLLPILTEEVDLVYPFGEVDPTGEMRPKTRRFRVIGTFKSGYYNYDNKFLVVDLAEARRLVPASEVPTEWGVWVKNIFDAPKMAHHFSQMLQGSFKAETWGEHNRKLFGALRLERIAMFSVLALMIAIATFNVFSLTMMMAVDKTKEIAILLSMGMKRRRIQKIFFKIGLILGILGTASGLILGLGAVLFLKWKPFHVPSPYYLESLPVKIDPISVLLVAILAPLLTLFASWYPARKGGRFEIVESLRYE